MNMMKSVSKLACFAFFLVIMVAANAQQLEAGKQYTVLTPAQPTEAVGNKIEVIEFFSYECPHCNSLEPTLNAWVKKSSADVHFRRVPVLFNRESWAAMARAYYTFETLGKVEHVHADVFKGIHEQQLTLSDEKVITDWAEKHGIDRKKFTEAYHSFSVQSKLARAKQMNISYAIQSVPTIVIDGKYVTSPVNAGGNDALPAVLDKLVALARQTHAKAAKPATKP